MKRFYKIVSIILCCFLLIGCGEKTEGTIDDGIQQIEEDVIDDDLLDMQNELKPTDTKEDILDALEEKDSSSVTNEIEPLGSSKDAIFSGSAYIEMNNNVPDFNDEELSTTSYEKYAELDALGRCGVCVANIGTDIMPTEKRGEIGSVKPTGWQTVKYDEIVDGKYLYNRCHLIGYQLTGENANEENLITGTRYMNVEGMLPFENMVADYIKETGNHVLYRVTPFFDGDNLLASGVQIEAKSVEDQGEGILFNVYCYNVQPGIFIDYENGQSRLDESYQKNNSSEKSDDIAGRYAVNPNNGKIHIVGDCPATGTAKNAMKSPVYFDTYEEAETYSKKRFPQLKDRNCGNCW